MTDISKSGMTGYDRVLEAARWNRHGRAVNVTAAAADACLWLDQVVPQSAEDRYRLQQCRRQLCRLALEAS